jgi:hypothetical protein
MKRIRDVLSGLAALQEALRLGAALHEKAQQDEQTAIEEAIQQDRQQDAQAQHARRPNARRDPPLTPPYNAPPDRGGRE